MLPGLLKKIQLVLLEISKRITSWFFALFVSGCLWIILGVINLLVLDGGPAKGARFLGRGPLFSPSRWANLGVFDAPPSPLVEGRDGWPLVPSGGHPTVREWKLISAGVYLVGK